MLLSLHSLLQQLHSPAYVLAEQSLVAGLLKRHSLGAGVGLVTQRLGCFQSWPPCCCADTNSGQKLLENLFSYIQMTQSDAKTKPHHANIVSRLSAAKRVLCCSVGVRARYVRFE